MELNFYNLKKYGIKREKRIRKGKLSGITLEYLKKEFKTKSKKQGAEELGVSKQSLHEKLRKLGYKKQ